jgi:hypothetical protein
MILKAIIEDQVYTLNVPDPVIARGAGFFDQLDRDMDQGWQMSRDWVSEPNRLQRCQIVADKLLTALEKENDKLGMLMAGYILSRLPNVESVELDLQGEIQNNQFTFREDSAASEPAAEVAEPSAGTFPDSGAVPAGLSKLEAMTQAGHDVTKVFKVGKAWRFSVFDHESQTWQDSPLIATEPEAERLRQAAFKERYELLQR